MYGESGNDFLDAYGTGTDTLDGGTGNDNLVSFDSGCKMFGGSGDDVLNTHGGGRDTLDGGPGTDYALVEPI